MPLNRPPIQPTAPALPHGFSPDEIAGRLIDGDRALVTSHYGSGVAVLNVLKRRLFSNSPQDYGAKRAAQQRYDAVAERLIAPIADHRVALKGIGEIGLIKLLYPVQREFCLAFPHIQQLYGAWQRYQEGAHFAVIGRRLHPFYGVYAPTRTSHLELFGTWLSQYKGEKQSAADIGTGCGVLAFMLSRAGFKQTLATDINPNAVKSLRLDLERKPAAQSIHLRSGDLFCNTEDKHDVIVFNPPWVEGEPRRLLDIALMYKPTLFTRFFDQAHARLKKNGRVVLIFSTALKLLKANAPHPIEAELQRGRFALKQKLQRKVKPGKGKDGRRRKTREKVEIWELLRAD